MSEEVKAVWWGEVRNKSDETRRLGGIVEHTMRMIDPSVIHGARRLSAGLS